MTRFAVLSDVHANLPALQAVLGHVADEDVSQVLCLGDLVGYGVWPDECVALLRQVQARCVVGNHDLMAVGALGRERCSSLAGRTLDWTAEVLQPATREYLAGLPRTLVLDGVLLAHGSPTDPEEYVTTGHRARELLAAASQPVLLLGHTHHQWAVDATGRSLLRRRTGEVALPSGRVLLNPGSVGQSRDRDTLARYLVLDTSARRAWFRAVGYQVEAAAAAVRAVGFPVEVLSFADGLPLRAAKSVRRRVLARLRRSPARSAG